MNIILKGWSAYTRMTARWPGIAAIIPFIPQRNLVFDSLAGSIL